MVSWLHLCLGMCLVATVVPGGQAFIGMGSIFEVIFGDHTANGYGACIHNITGNPTHALCPANSVCIATGETRVVADPDPLYAVTNGWRCQPHYACQVTSDAVDTPAFLEFILLWLQANPDHTQVLANLLMRNLQGECTLPATETVVEALSGLPT